MHLSEAWLIPLGFGAAGALTLTLLSVRLRKQVELLQKSMRPLRVERRASRHR